MELARFLRLLRRWWWLLVLGVVIGGGSAYAVSQVIAPIYRASTTLLVNQTQTPGVIAYNDILTSERLTKTYRELITKRPVLDDVIAGFGLDLDASELSSMIDVQVVRDTQLLRLSVEHEEPGTAQLLANGVAGAFIEANEGDELSRPGSVTIVEPARIPTSPVRPRTTLNSLLGAFAGLLLAAAFALLYEYLDDTVKAAEDVEEAASLPTLGGVTRFPRARTPADALVVSPTEQSAVAEAYRVLRTNIQFSTFDAKTLLISSSGPREGKTTTTANLAAAISQTGQRVIVVDSDLRRPAIHHIFGLSNGAGLTNALLSREPDPSRFLQPTQFENLSVLTSGPQPPNPSELLSSGRMDAVIQAVREQADIVLFDSPPILAVADATVLAAKLDGAILVIDSGRTRAPALRRTAEALARSKTRILGAILNKLTERAHGYYYGYAYYYTRTDDPDDGDGTGGGKFRLPWTKAARTPAEGETYA